MAEDVIDAGGGGSPPPLELIGVSKSFGGVAALRDVSFTLEAGEIHGLDLLTEETQTIRGG